MQPQAEPWLLQRGEDEMDEGETAALQSMPLKLQQKKKKESNTDSFPLWGLQQKKGGVQVLIWGRSGFLHAQMHQ